mmetsp:Transcript_32632/g.82525  ORF Transcript_32632/g.82525 Transcript_32632/m.82525 type:complete len:284 (+) Transcript_32632:4380-5231(+)
MVLALRRRARQGHLSEGLRHRQGTIQEGHHRSTIHHPHSTGHPLTTAAPPSTTAARRPSTLGPPRHRRTSGRLSSVRDGGHRPSTGLPLTSVREGHRSRHMGAPGRLRSSCRRAIGMGARGHRLTRRSSGSPSLHHRAAAVVHRHCQMSGTRWRASGAIAASGRPQRSSLGTATTLSTSNLMEIISSLEFPLHTSVLPLSGRPCHQVPPELACLQLLVMAVMRRCQRASTGTTTGEGEGITTEVTATTPAPATEPRQRRGHQCLMMAARWRMASCRREARQRR